MASFSKAFADARKSGKKTFSWNGKSFNTKLAASPKTPKNVPVPSAKPDQTKTGSTPQARAKADYPKPAAALGIARKGSALSNAKARMDNAPVSSTEARKPRQSQSNPKGTMPMGKSTPGASRKAAKTAQGPTPEGVWYARKGSPISIAAARRANRPKSK